MAYVITKPCIGVKDTACVAVCPCDCIHPTKSEADFTSAEMLLIDPTHCVDCGLCVDECPVKAIFQQDDVPEALSEFIEKNAAYYRDPSQMLAC
jgi:ferredoxin--NADP+ reductase